MAINAYLLFNGNCAEAFAAYTRILGGKITFSQAYGNSPMADKVSQDWRDKIMHITMQRGSDVLQGSDAPPGNFEEPQGFSLSIAGESVAEGKRIFTALAEGGTVKMSFQETFWAKGFGMLVDRFGIPWMVNCE